jgi:hypothetical protein
MITHICDRCGQPIEAGQLRFLARIEVFAPPDVLPIGPQDLFSNTTEEMEQILKQCEGMTEEELMRDVYVNFEFDLCRPCQQAYIANPLPTT